VGGARAAARFDCRADRGEAGCARGAPVGRGSGAREVRPPAAGGAQAVRSMMAACGPPRPGSWVTCAGGLGPTARSACGPTAAQGSMRSPKRRSDREGRPRLTSENRAWACQDLNLGPHPETKIARVATGSAAPRRAALGRAHRFSSLVAAHGHGGLISYRGLSAVRQLVSQVVLNRRCRSYQGETWMLDSPEGVCAGQAPFENPATSALFSSS
jgi:hypothetical protein